MIGIYGDNIIYEHVKMVSCIEFIIRMSLAHGGRMLPQMVMIQTIPLLLGEQAKPVPNKPCNAYVNLLRPIFPRSLSMTPTSSFLPRMPPLKNSS